MDWLYGRTVTCPAHSDTLQFRLLYSTYLCRHFHSQSWTVFLLRLLKKSKILEKPFNKLLHSVSSYKCHRFILNLCYTNICYQYLYVCLFCIKSRSWLPISELSLNLTTELRREDRRHPIYVGLSVPGSSTCLT